MDQSLYGPIHGLPVGVTRHMNRMGPEMRATITLPQFLLFTYALDVVSEDISCRTVVENGKLYAAISAVCHTGGVIGLETKSGPNALMSLILDEYSKAEDKSSAWDTATRCAGLHLENHRKQFEVDPTGLVHLQAAAAYWKRGIDYPQDDVAVRQHQRDSVEFWGHRHNMEILPEAGLAFATGIVLARKHPQLFRTELDVWPDDVLGLHTPTLEHLRFDTDYGIATRIFLCRTWARHCRPDAEPIVTPNADPQTVNP